MSTGDLHTAVIRQRQELLTTLDALTPDEWEIPSLCAGWRVRDVVGHLVSMLQVPTSRFVVNAARARSVDRYVDQLALEYGARDTAWLVAALRIFADKQIGPPVIGPVVSLVDAMVHTRDIERPLGRPSRLDDDVQRELLDRLCHGSRFGSVISRATRHVRLEAVDLDWTHGAGPAVVGTGEALLLALHRRDDALEELKGDGVELLLRSVAA